MSQRAGLRVVLAALIALAGSGAASAADAPSSQSQPPKATVKTGKERLGDKASDEQRVDDCKVPPERRSRTRPANCPSNN
jgi:hypothetical protein